MKENKLMELQSMAKIPEEFRVYFWDADFDKLDLNKNMQYIISRLYTKGDFKEIEWVHNTYTDEEVKETARCRRSFDPITANFLREKYDLQKTDMAYYRFEKMGGNELWKY